MTEYIHPIRDLQGSLRRTHQALILLGVLLGLSILAVPSILRGGPVVVMDQETFSRVTKAAPWRLTVSRMEGFTRSYLASRWEWKPEDFQTKKSNLESLVQPATFTKLKDSLNALESLSKAQKARSYYVLEDWGFSNSERKIEAKIDRVIRIGSAAVATPLTIHLIYQEAPVSEANPYGLKVESLEEIEVQGGGA